MKKIIRKLTVTTILISVLAVAFLGLVLNNIKDMVFGAPLVVHTVADGSTLNNNYVTISGSAKHAKSITINGLAVGTDRDGNFSDGVILSPGYNIVQVAATDRFGRSKDLTYRWVDVPPVSVAQNNVTPYQR